MKPKKAKKSTTPSTCPECGCGVDQPHIGSCGIERCTRCGDKCVSCGRCEGHDPLKAAWTGIIPTYRMTVQALAKWVKEWARQPSERYSPLQDEILDNLCFVLVSLGIETVEATYDGSGDEGAVNWVNYEPSDVAVPEGLEGIIEEFVDVILPIGYELDDGASGTVTIAPGDSPRIEVEHQRRIIDSEDSYYSID